MAFVIRDRESLAAFLSEHGGFEDASVTLAEPVAVAGVVPDEVRLTLAYQTRGDYRAGSTRTMSEVDLIGSGVIEWTLTDASQHAPGHCVEEIVLLDLEGAIGLEVDLPGRVRLVCRELTVGSTRSWDEVVPLWLSQQEWYAEVARDAVPSPREWVEALAARGFAVAWHLYGGEPVEPTEVPAADYEGWYLGLIDREGALLGDCQHRRGLFIRLAVVVDARLRLALGSVGAEADLWRAASAILDASDEGEVRCGNGAFALHEWRSYLRSGELPQRFRPE